MRNMSGRHSALWFVALSAVFLAGCGRSPAPPDFSGMVKRVSPSVVSITAAPAADDSENSPPASSSSSTDTPPWARKYLQPAWPGDGDGDHGEYGGEAAVSTGSGFVLWPNGYILTDQHVVGHSPDITVRLSDGRQFPAKVVGVDRRSDIALLKIKADNLPAVRIADDRQLAAGQWVVAIGAPFGFDHSVTAGIVSALHRSLASQRYVPFIQTDAAINPGNSGGPLFNVQGEVVGITSQIYSQTGGFMGVAFATPIDLAVRVAKQLRATGHVQRGWMGVTVQELTLPLAQSFGLKIPHGALVTGIAAGGPAEQAGIRAGDVLLSFNGVDLDNSRELPPLVGKARPGEVVKLRVLRDRRVVNVSVQLGRLSSDHAAAEGRESESPARPQGRGVTDFGLTLRSAKAFELSKAGISSGLMVEQVAPGPAREAGVQPGDLIVSIDGQHPRSPAQFRALVQRLTPGSSVPILVQRASGPIFLAVQVAPR